MKQYRTRIAAFCGLTILCLPAAYADGNPYSHYYRGHNPSYKDTLYFPSGVAVGNGSVIYIGDRSYGYGKYRRQSPYYQQHRYNNGYNYRRGDKSHAYPRYRLNNQSRRHLPSTSIYGAYPYREPYDRPRVNPHASSYQKKYSTGGGTPGYNHYSPRGNADWYRY